MQFAPTSCTYIVSIPSTRKVQQTPRTHHYARRNDEAHYSCYKDTPCWQWSQQGLHALLPALAMLAAVTTRGLWVATNTHCASSSHNKGHTACRNSPCWRRSQTSLAALWLQQRQWQACAAAGMHQTAAAAQPPPDPVAQPEPGHSHKLEQNMVISSDSQLMWQITLCRHVQNLYASK